MNFTTTPKEGAKEGATKGCHLRRMCFYEAFNILASEMFCWKLLPKTTLLERPSVNLVEMRGLGPVPGFFW